MKSSAKAIYFSAYPLKAVEKAAATAVEAHQSPYLKALIAGQKKSVSNLRVTPMVNPYNTSDLDQPAKLRPQQGKEMEPQGKEWYNHYE